MARLFGHLQKFKFATVGPGLNKPTKMATLQNFAKSCHTDWDLSGCGSLKTTLSGWRPLDINDCSIQLARKGYF